MAGKLTSDLGLPFIIFAFIGGGLAGGTFSRRRSSSGSLLPCIGPIKKQRAKAMKIYIETYGCTANLSDSQGIRNAVLAAGGTITENPDEADAVIVNTWLPSSPRKACSGRYENTAVRSSSPLTA